MEKTVQLYEGKAKKVFATTDPAYYIVDYKDDATAFNGLKKGTIQGKGEINNRVTNHLMGLLEKKGRAHPFRAGALSPGDPGQESGHRTPGGHRAQHRRRFPGQAPGPGGGHQAGPHGAGVLLQKR